MRRCIIKVAGACYTALFPSTCAALEDAMKRFPGATTISVRTDCRSLNPSLQH